METKIVTPKNDEEINVIGKMLKEGYIVALPTETVYGLGANGLDEEAISKIYEAKGRPSDNPLILHVCDVHMVKDLVGKISLTAEKLIKAFWPGPLTIILKKSKLVPNSATGGLNTVALRCPDNELCRRIIKAAQVPIAAPSANLSGRPSPTTAQDVYSDMNGRILCIVDDGACPVGIESTIVEVGENSVTILRPGVITESMLKKVVATVLWDQHLLGEKEIPKAPGMKYKHYSPDAPMTILVGNPEVIAKRLQEIMISLSEDSTKDTLKVGVFISNETESLLSKVEIGDRVEMHIIPYGSYHNPGSLAQKIYESLNRFNQLGVDYIWAEGTFDKEIGKAIMNRLDKASNHTIEYL